MARLGEADGEAGDEEEVGGRRIKHLDVLRHARALQTSSNNDNVSNGGYRHGARRNLEFGREEACKAWGKDDEGEDEERGEGRNPPHPARE